MTIDTTTGYIRLLDDPVDDPPPDVVRCALETVSAVSVALDMPGLPLWFFLPCNPDDPGALPMQRDPLHIGGFVTPSAKRVFIRGDLSVTLTATVAAHESRHIWQRRRGLHTVWTDDDIERDAHRFDQLWMARTL